MTCVSEFVVQAAPSFDFEAAYKQQKKQDMLAAGASLDEVVQALVTAEKHVHAAEACNSRLTPRSCLEDLDARYAYANLRFARQLAENILDRLDDIAAD